MLNSHLVFRLFDRHPQCHTCQRSHLIKCLCSAIAIYLFRVYDTLWQVWDTSGKCFIFWTKPVYENQNFQEWRGQVCQRTFLLSTWEGQCILLLKVYSTICITCDVFIATFPSVFLLLLHRHTTHTLETVEPPKNTCQGTLKIRECHYYLFFHLDWNILGIFIHVGHGATILLLVQQ